MRISKKVIEQLVNIITGNSGKSPYRSGPQLIEFFHEFGESDQYRNFPARHEYVREKLRKFNGTLTMDNIVSAAFDFFSEDDFNPEEEAETFNRLLVKDGYRLELVNQSDWMDGDKYVQGDPCFKVQPTLRVTINPAVLATISDNAVKEQIAKARKRTTAGDYAGAIASSYTLTEQLLKLILREEEVSFKENEGDIRLLYKLVREPLNLNPGGDSIASPLKPILDGLQKLVAGLFEISNKASDRHARRYNPAKHHANLAVNAAFVLCEFLVESRDYQHGRDGHAAEDQDREVSA